MERRRGAEDTYVTPPARDTGSAAIPQSGKSGLQEDEVNVSKKSRLRMLGSGAALLALCTSSAFWMAPVQAAPSAAGTIKIGAYAPLSGPYASAGVDMVRAVRLAVSNVNKHGG